MSEQLTCRVKLEGPLTELKELLFQGVDHSFTGSTPVLVHLDHLDYASLATGDFFSPGLLVWQIDLESHVGTQVS